MSVKTHPLSRTAGLADRHLEGIAAALEQSRRPETRRAYASVWKQFRAWAEGEGLESLPADPLTVAAYLVHRAEAGLSLASLAMDRKAISYHHRTAGFSTPTASEGVKQTLAGLKNRAADTGRTEPRQARGLTAEALEAIRRTARQPRSGPTGRTESERAARRRGEMDIAIASVMRDALLRRSEAAELRWGDVSFAEDGSARLRVRRSKTASSPALLYLGQDATTALRRVMPENIVRQKRVFGLRSGRAVSNRVAAMARAAGLGEGFSGHSPRVGMAQDLTAAGVGLTAIMVAGRWKSERMPAHYSRAQKAERSAVAQFYRGGGEPPVLTEERHG